MKRNKSKEQIINSFENRFVLTFVSGAIWFTTIAVISIIAAYEVFDNLVSLSIAIIGWSIAIVVLGFAVQCPICDCTKSAEYFDVGFMRTQTGFFRCDKCNLSSKQIREYVSLLQRGVDIDENTIARFNRREL